MGECFGKCMSVCVCVYTIDLRSRGCSDLKELPGHSSSAPTTHTRDIFSTSTTQA